MRFDRRNFEKKMLQTGILQLAEEEYDDIADVFTCFEQSDETNSFFGKTKEMRTKSIDELFGGFKPSDSEMKFSDINCSLNSEAPTIEPAKRKPGRKGRKYSFNKDEYDRFKKNNNFRFEF